MLRSAIYLYRQLPEEPPSESKRSEDLSDEEPPSGSKRSENVSDWDYANSNLGSVLQADAPWGLMSTKDISTPEAHRRHGLPHSVEP